ncbi:MAG: peptidase, partial [Frankiales bacterium]|nr:peptidase [Frankiales bacterium]
VLLPPASAQASPDPLGDLPHGVSPVARVAPAPLPTPSSWPFPDAFPETSGTGRLVEGAMEWTDFLYDDHGAHGLASTGYTGEGSPASQGTYAYPDGPARHNGADIFRAAVGKDAKASYWRVDWTTLVDANVPLAVFAFDTDDDAATGTSSWPAGAGLTSPGLDKGLVISAKGAWLQGIRVADTAVDLTANSFVVRLPDSVLPTEGRWKVRLASGLADPAGKGFAAVSGGSLPGQPPVYNVTFRDEDPASNSWMDKGQAAAIGSGDVSAYGTVVDWSALRARTTTPEVRRTGISMRWYPSSLPLGEGSYPNASNSDGGTTLQDYEPNLRSRPQPYSVYVPTTYDEAKPAKLTWILHSLGSIYTQYTAGPASDLKQFCEDRYSVCVMPEGRGPDLFWYDAGEYDLWQVWNRVATDYALDPTSTVVTGFSMGGCGSYSWPLAYPDVFAEAAPMAGITANKAYRFAIPSAVFPGSPEVSGLDFSPRYTAIGDQDPLVENARWMRFFIVQGLLDELVPVTQNIQMADRFQAFGQRYRLQLHPAEGHTEWYTKGMYGAIATNLENPHVAVRPGHVTYVWHPGRFHPEWGMPATGSFWVKEPVARQHADADLARIDATSGENPDPVVTTHVATSALASTDPSPALVREQTWTTGARAAASPTLVLTLTNVASLTIDLPGAGFAPTEWDTDVTVTTDGPSALELQGLSEAATLLLDGQPVTGRLVVPAGTHHVTLRRGGRSSADGLASGRLPATGSPGGAAVVGGLLLLLTAAVSRRRLATRPVSLL